jgi:hypothetical protein
VHDDSGLFACGKGWPTKEATRLRLECPKQIEDDLKSIREDFLMNEKSQMLVMLSMATDKMIQLVAMYPDVWFMDTTAGKSVYISFYINSMMPYIPVTVW